MTHGPNSLDTIFDSIGGNISALAAILHFRRTGKRCRPRLIAVNGKPPLRREQPRPALRVVACGGRQRV
jgi:hypothetical protein